MGLDSVVVLVVNGVVEKVMNLKEHKKLIPMNEPFLKYRSKGLKVSELAQQLWCEKKVELELIYGKEETPEMIKGSERHKELFEEITPVLEVQLETWIDEIFVRCYQMWSLSCKVLNEKIAREVPIYGKVGIMVIKGVIDELTIRDGKLFVVETKTRASGEVPDYQAYERVVTFQISLYKLLLDNIKKGYFTCSDLIEFYGIESDSSISETLSNSFPENTLITTNVELMASIAFETLKTLPETSDTMVVRYENQNKEFIGEREFTFDKESLEKTIDFVLGYWEGTREAVPALKNVWKCRYCPDTLRDKCDAFKK